MSASTIKSPLQGHNECTGGFRAQLSTVAAGTYVSNNSYGSGAATVSNYGALQVAAQSAATLRVDGPRVDFDLAVVVTTTAAAPAFAATDELRIRVQPLTASEFGRLAQALPPPGEAALPRFFDVEVIDPATGLPPAGFPAVAGGGQLAARLLYAGQELALYVWSSTSTSVPLTVADLTPLFGGVIPSVRLSVRGAYRHA